MFTQGTFNFLAQLAANNNRDWFKDNQPRYESLVRGPALDFIEQIQPLVLSLSPRLTAIPKKVGGSLMRPQRDARFSHDKTPYKSNVGIHFRHFQGKDIHAPGLYLHLSNDNCHLAAGIWHPESAPLNAIRTCIDENPAAYSAALKALITGGFSLYNENNLVRPPKGFSKDHPLVDELKRKDFIAVKQIPLEKVLQKDFSTWCAREYEHTQKLMKYLCFALELDY